MASSYGSPPSKSLKGKVLERNRHMKTITKFTCPAFAALVLACVSVLSRAQAVVPPPDGGYPGDNTVEGTSALFSLTSGMANTALGSQALYSNTISSYNTAQGCRALFSNTTGAQNTAVGASVLVSNTTGSHNTANGVNALYSNTDGSYNTAIGDRMLFSNQEGVNNTATGYGALFSNTSGGHNTAVGVHTLFDNLGSFNTALGFRAASSTTYSHYFRGAYNTAIGSEALAVSTGSVYNTAIGFQAMLGGPNSFLSSYNTAVGVQALPDTGGHNNIAFHYKTDTTGTPQFGLIAEEVAKVNPALVLPDNEGKPYTVRYDPVNAMLLNEFLKEHRKVEQLETTAAQQAKEIQIYVRLSGARLRRLKR
jgi:hypothetical protein